MPGPPFAFGAILVIMALVVALFIPDNYNRNSGSKSPTRRNAPIPLENLHRETGWWLYLENHSAIFVVGLF